MRAIYTCEFCERKFNDLNEALQDEEGCKKLKDNAVANAKRAMRKYMKLSESERIAIADKKANRLAAAIVADQRKIRQAKHGVVSMKYGFVVHNSSGECEIFDRVSEVYTVAKKTVYFSPSKDVVLDIISQYQRMFNNENSGLVKNDSAMKITELYELYRKKGELLYNKFLKDSDRSYDIGEFLLPSDMQIEEFGIDKDDKIELVCEFISC